MQRNCASAIGRLGQHGSPSSGAALGLALLARVLLEAGRPPGGIFPLALLTQRAARDPQGERFLAKQALLSVPIWVCICAGWIRGFSWRRRYLCGGDEGLHRLRVGALWIVEGATWIGRFSGLVAHALHHQPA